MRVTQSATTRQYMRNLNRNLSSVNSYNDKISSGRQFNRAHENPASAARALMIRRTLLSNQTYQNNLDTAEEILSSAESSLRLMSSVSQEIGERIIYGMNGTQSQTERDITAENLDNLSQELIKMANIDFSGRYLFSGSNNAPPFTTGENGELLFNGQAVDTATSFDDFPMNKRLYVDIGLGLKTDGTNIDPQSALEVSVSGVEALGFGTDENGLPRNLISLTQHIANAFRDPNTTTDELGEMLDAVEGAKKNLLVTLTSLGSRSNFIEFNRQRLESDEFNLTKSQTDVEGIDQAATITEYKVSEMAYRATLQMGTHVIPPSIFDFIR